jgi:hypothetical protein
MCPIIGDKEGKKEKFGSKLQVSFSDGFVLIDELNWDNFNEGGCLKGSVVLYKRHPGYYPEKVLADSAMGYRKNWQINVGSLLLSKPYLLFLDTLTFSKVIFKLYIIIDG